jgi:hypothetical protein
MVRFGKEKFVVEVSTSFDTVGDWRNTFDQMIDLLQSEHEEMRANRYFFLELLRAMLPDEETAEKMCPEETEQ